MNLARWIVFFLVFLTLACTQTPPEPTGPTAADIAENNKGVGLMGYFDYPGAHAVFQALIDKYPDWSDVKVNLAVATLNLQTEESENQALAILAEVLAVEPDNLRAQYCTGLLNLYQGDTEAALARFSAVVEADPSDAHAAYYRGQCHARLGDHATAVTWYERAIEREPYLRSAYYGLFQAYQRTGKPTEAREMLAQFQKLDGNPQSLQAEFKYTRMGPRANAHTIDIDDTAPAQTPEGALFADAETITAPDGWAWRAVTEPRAVTTVDLDRDGDQDIFITGALTNDEEVRHAILLNDGAAWAFALDHPLATAATDAHAVLWGDADNDALIDAYFCRTGPNQLWRGSEDGWRDDTDASAVSGGDVDTRNGLWLDADHDGDLDIFLVNNGPNQLLNNDLDGAFREIAAEGGIAGDAGSSALIASDLDADRDLDLLILNDGAHEVYANDRLWQYQPAQGFEGLSATPLAALLAADSDADGQVELFAAGADKLTHWTRGDDNVWTARNLLDGGAKTMAVDYFSGATRPELAVHDDNGWRVLTLDGTVLHQVDTPAAVWATLNLDAKGPTVLTLDAAGVPHIHRPGPGRQNFIALSFTGKEDKGAGMRSNALGVGARFAARTGSEWSASDTFPRHSGLGQSHAPVAVGLGMADQLDYVAIHWSDGVFQTELGLEANDVKLIPETQRQLSSCPVVFVWNGEKFEFVSDILGVAGIGYAVGPGQYSEPRPWENFQFPAGIMKPKDGEYHIRITEPMEESAYLDQIQLFAYDLPPGWQMVLDERMGFAEPMPTGEPRYYRRELQPVRAANQDDLDVLDAILTQDHKASPIPETDPRFIGYLSREQVLTFAFDAPVDGDGAMLIIDGWVEYPYSQTNFSAWQADKTLETPTLEARDASGEWQTVYANFGYPAGMPRRMSMPLNGLPSGAKELRLRTTAQVYFDRISVGFAEDLPQARRTELTMTQAELAELGFAKRTTGPQRLPHYDDDQRAPLWDTRHQAGFYTRFGDVRELLTKHDDAVAIIGPGEGVTLAFQAPLTGPPRDWTRTLVLGSRGWCKDMDLFTRDGETLRPMPSSGKPSAGRWQLQTQYNTRYRSGY